VLRVRLLLLLLVHCGVVMMQLWQEALGLCFCSIKTDAFAAVRGAAYSIPHECCTSM
jgi:hypothetical protein